MAWVITKANVDGQAVSVMIKDDLCQIPTVVGIEVGDIIEVDGKSYRVTDLTMFRDEAYIAKVEETGNGKSTSRGSRGKARKRNVQSKDESGLDSPDREETGDEHSDDSSEPSSGSTDS